MAVVALGRRERKKLELRDKICEETMRLIARHGIEGTTIDAICDCADIAKKTFYNYYSAKHDLLIDICQSNLLDRSEALIAAALQQGHSLSERLDYVFAEMVNNNHQAGFLEKQLIEYLVANMGVNKSQGAGQLQFMNDCFEQLFASSPKELRNGLSPTFCARWTCTRRCGTRTCCCTSGACWSRWGW